MSHRTAILFKKHGSGILTYGQAVNMIYELIAAGNQEMAAELHGSKNKFRPFAHARDESDQSLTVYFSSVFSEITKTFVEGVNKVVGTGMMFGNCLYKIEDVIPLMDPSFWPERLKVKTVSPAVISRNNNGRKEYINYNRNNERPWIEAMERNLRLRHLTFKGSECSPKVKVIHSGRTIITEYMGTKIPSMDFTLEVKGERELLASVVYAGIGERTGSGFGMVFPV